MGIKDGPVALGVPLLDPIAAIVAMVRDIEIAGGIHREGSGIEYLAQGCASGDSHRPISLGVPLLDPVVPTICHIEVAGGIHREVNSIADLADGGAFGGNHGPVALGIPLLDPVSPVANVTDIEIALG